MGASELRIGIYMDVGIFALQNSHQVVDIKDLSPIPLTEEWMFKFGFKYNPKGTYDDFMEGYYMHPNLDEVCFDHTFEPAITGNDWGPSYISKSDMRFVHKLQNLYFALTGEELTIKP